MKFTWNFKAKFADEFDRLPDDEQPSPAVCIAIGNDSALTGGSGPHAERISLRIRHHGCQQDGYSLRPIG